MSKRTANDYSDEAEIKQLRNIANEVFGIKIGRIVHSGSVASVVGIKSEYILVSQRLDSRTFFVQDTRYGADRKAGVFRGQDKEHVKVCRDILKRLR